MATVASKRAALLVAGGAILALAACSGASDSTAQLVNPASANCVAQGGRLVIETAGDGGQYGVCLFEDNRQCEEWALLRGACPVGGIKVTGYVTPQARYCAIKGGDYVVVREQTDAAPEEGSCSLPGEPACDALALYEGRCPE
jgi:putative hemolysin